MIAAVYARKSTEQIGVSDEGKSVTRQIDHAKAYAARKGWAVDDGCVFVDDGISGAEFANRPGFLRMMNTLKPKPAFQVLVMSEESRLGREAIETAYALKQLVQAGVQVWFYMEDRQRTLDSPTDKIMMSLTAFADELEREKGRQRTYDAMTRKARAGYVTGGRVFGYDNIEVPGPDGKRAHVLRQVNTDEAAIVRRIFQLCAAGTGYTRIAKLLNAEGAPAPRPQQGRPAGWAPSTVNEILHRELYRGVILWNRTRKRNQWGEHRVAPRPDTQWMRMEAPELRIVTEADWQAVRERLGGIRARLLVASGGRIGARARDIDSHYLLPGFSRCGVCGGALAVVTRQHGKVRVPFYSCMAHHKRGQAVCGNRTIVALDRLDAAVLQAIGGDVLRPAVVGAVVAGVLDALDGDDTGAERQRLTRELQTVTMEAARLTEAIAAGGQIGPLLAALKVRQDRRTELERLLDVPDPTRLTAKDRRRIEADVRRRLEDWRGLLARGVQEGRDLLRQVLAGPLRVWPLDGQARAYRFEGEVDLGRLFAGVAGLPTLMASPAGFEPAF